VTYLEAVAEAQRVADAEKVTMCVIKSSLGAWMPMTWRYATAGDSRIALVVPPMEVGG